MVTIPSSKQKGTLEEGTRTERKGGQLSGVSLLLWTVAHQAPPPMGFFSDKSTGWWPFQKLLIGRRGEARALKKGLFLGQRPSFREEGSGRGFIMQVLLQGVWGGAGVERAQEENNLI